MKVAVEELEAKDSSGEWGKGVVWAAVDGGFAAGGMGASEVMDSRVSAATIPPMEWPIRIVRTDGSIVGDGVEADTSRSMTTFWSLAGMV